MPTNFFIFQKKTSFIPVCKAVEDMYEQLEFTITQ